MPIAPNEQILAADVVATATANKIALRDAAARTKFAAPAAADDAAILSTVTDHAALTTAHGAVVAATASKMVVRDAEGQAKFAAPAEAGDALIKGTALTITEMAALTTGKIWQGVANRPSEVDLPATESGEGHITILPLSYEAIGQGTWEVAAPSAELVGTLTNNPPNDLDNLSYEAYLAAGTYTILLVGQHGAGGGIVDIDIEGTEVATFDLYNAATVKNQLDEDAGNVIATAGIKTITLRLHGKHASSAAYRLQFNYLVLWRTA